MRRLSTRQWAVTALVAAAACWGSTVVLVTVAGRSLSALGIALIEVASATVVLGIAVLLRRRRLVRPSRLLLLAGLLEPGLAYPVINAGIARTSGTHAALIIGLESVAIVVIAAIATTTKPGVRTVLALLFAVTGAGLLNGDTSGGASIGGDLLVVLGALTAAVYVVLVQSRLGHIDALAATFYQFVFGSGGVLVITFATQLRAHAAPLWPKHLSGGPLTAALVAGVLGSAVAFGLYNAALAHVDTPTAATSLSLIPLFGVAFSVIFLHNHLATLTIIAAVLVISGVAVTSRTSTPETSRRPSAAAPAQSAPARGQDSVLDDS